MVGLNRKHFNRFNGYIGSEGMAAKREESVPCRDGVRWDPLESLQKLIWNCHPGGYSLCGLSQLLRGALKEKSAAKILA